MSEWRRILCCQSLGLLLVSGLMASPVFAQDLDDPMRPTPTPPPVTAPAPTVPDQPVRPRFDPAAYELSAIYQVGNIRRARINGEWYVEQEDLSSDVTLVQIGSDRVQLRAADGTHELELERRRAQFRSPSNTEREESGSSSAPGRSEEAR